MDGPGTVLHTDALFSEAVRRFHAGELAAMEALCRDILALDPDHADSLHLLGMAAHNIGQYTLAVGLIGEAIARTPANASFHCNLGNALQALERLDEAADSALTALALQPTLAEAHNNLGTVYTRQRRLAEAEACFRTALAHGVAQPEIARYNLSNVLLAQGNLAAGWPEYENRWHTPHGRAEWRDLPLPRWRGEPAAGRRLVVHAEQGLGDTLQFCRYATLAARRGLRVTLEVQPPLVRLLRTLAGVERVIARGEDWPEADLHCPMLSLPLALGGAILAQLAYLRADPAAAASWRARLAEVRRPRIGLVWAGNPLAPADVRRSIPPVLLVPLFDVPGIEVFGLQKHTSALLPLTDHMAEMDDFADTAALVSNLDLVLAVDTAMAHLAAALGRPVWLLDRFDSCWRWFAGRRDSPWYPSLRIYRQPAPGDWDSVIAEVVRDLARWQGPAAARSRDRDR